MIVSWHILYIIIGFNKNNLSYINIYFFIHNNLS